ncbi:MAG: hypothetical protein WA708_00875 [Acidobacteriaceae bacterium]
MYWVYNLPNWLFELLTIIFFVGFSLAGLFATRKPIRRIHTVRSYNDIVGFYLAGITVLYGVTLGLLAIGAWTTYTDTEAKVAREAAALSSLYRGVASLPEPARSRLQADLREYTRHLVNVGWPEQQRGIVPVDDRPILVQFQQDFQSLEPTTSLQKIMEAEISRRFDLLEESRSVRLDSVSDELPSPLWVLILAGAFVCIVLTWFFQMESMKMHIWMTILFAGLIGLMVFMIAALDNPYRGKISVSPEPLQRVYSLMTKAAK